MNVLQQRSRRVGTTAGWCVILLAALTLGASSASASICYQVSLPIGAAQAAGSICTDGTSGDLVQSNITAWHLLLSNGNAQGSLLDSWVWDSTASDTPLVTFWQTATPDPLTATAAALQWDFVDPGRRSGRGQRTARHGMTCAVFWQLSQFKLPAASCRHLFRMQNEGAGLVELQLAEE